MGSNIFGNNSMMKNWSVPDHVFTLYVDVGNGGKYYPIKSFRSVEEANEYAERRYKGLRYKVVKEMKKSAFL